MCSMGRCGSAVVAGWAALALHVPSAWAAPCDRRASLQLPHTTITLANGVDAGAFVALTPLRGGGPPGPAAAGTPGRGGRGGPSPSPFVDLPAFCRVPATLTPSDDSEIKIELWMPVSGWNGKFVVPGNGGFAGAINPLGLASALRRG